MIQRVQSIYLLLAALSAAALFALPFATAPAETEGILQDGAFDISDHVGLIVLTALIALIALGTIFLYSNRTLQMNLGKLNIVLLMGLLGLAAYLYTTIPTTATVALGIGLGIPLLVLVFTLLANRNIQKDDRLVRSADRLR